MSLRDRFPRAFADRPMTPLGDHDIDDQAPSEYLRASLYEGLRKFEPDATLHAFASVRLFGERFESALFERHSAEIFLRLQREIDCAAPGGAKDLVQMGIRAIDSGSVIMTLEPINADVPAEGAFEVSAASALEIAFLRVLDIHDALEKGKDVQSVDGASNDLFGKLRQLVAALDDADAGLELDFARSNGARRQSVLSATGRARARSLFAPKESIEISVVAGTLLGIEISHDGERAKVSVKTGKKRKVVVVDVPARDAKALSWDTHLRIQVRTVESVGFGGESSREHQFIKVLGHDEVLPDS